MTCTVEQADMFRIITFLSAPNDVMNLEIEIHASHSLKSAGQTSLKHTAATTPQFLFACSSVELAPVVLIFMLS